MENVKSKITYHQEGDYLIPNLTVPNDENENYQIGKYGHLRLSYLKNHNELNDVGGVEYLTEVLNFVPTASNIDYYIQNVEETALLRRLIETATEIAEEGYRTDETVNDILDSSEKKILSIVKNRKSSEFRSIKDVLNKTQLDLERLSENKGEITGLSTKEINKLAG